MGIVDFLIGTVKAVGRLIFGGSSSSSNDDHLMFFGMFSSLFLWIFMIYILVKIASKPFEKGSETQELSGSDIEEMIMKNKQEQKRKEERKNFQPDRVK